MLNEAEKDITKASAKFDEILRLIVA